jgi:hypothetical protein
MFTDSKRQVPVKRQVLFRLSQEEFDAMERSAASQDRSLSYWVRAVVVAHLRATGYLPERKAPGQESGAATKRRQNGD